MRTDIYSMQQRKNWFNFKMEKNEGSSWTEDSSLSSKSQEGNSPIESMGCPHYKRNCMKKCPDCNLFFTCRLCHNEEMFEKEPDFKKKHELRRHAVQTIKCLKCSHEQKVSSQCEECGTVFGQYFCAVCKFFDNDTNKKIYHCDKCGICRIGVKEDYLHCDKCGGCWLKIEEEHKCLENSLKHDCPVCLQDLFTSRDSAMKIPGCNHTIHQSCFRRLARHKLQCPLCCKSFVDMTEINKTMDEEIEATPMPDEYKDKKIMILCNDCSEKSEVNFHILGMKCLQCQSYNTRNI